MRSGWAKAPGRSGSFGMPMREPSRGERALAPLMEHTTTGDGVLTLFREQGVASMAARVPALRRGGQYDDKHK